MQPFARRVLIALALTATMVAVLWPQPEPQTATEAAPRTRAGAPRESSLPLATLTHEIRRAAMSSPATDAFAPRSWRPPPPPPTSVKAPAPQAPPLPYRYLGKLIETGSITVFLARGEQNLAVKVGQTLDGQYRIDAVTASALTLTYLPLAKQQTLSLGRSD